MKKNTTIQPQQKAALYNPYLDSLGGGERYILSILKVLQRNNIDISIFWDKNIEAEIEEKFHLGMKTIHFQPNIFSKSSNVLEKLQQLQKFDYFLYVTDGSYFFSSAKNNYIYAMVPQKSLYKKSLMTKIKTLNYHFITHSKFTQAQLNKWGISSQLLYPYIDCNPSQQQFQKQKIILSVGRFFSQLHSKRQDIIVSYFKALQNTHPQFRDFKLILTGGLMRSDMNYYEAIKELVGNDRSIELKPNTTHAELTTLYQKSMFYWHFAGMNVDESLHPEQVEHMGITPLEAMSFGTIPFCYAAGGPKEIVNDGENGYLFIDKNELFNKLNTVVSNTTLQQQLVVNGMKYVHEQFSYDAFEKNVIRLLDLNTT